MTQTFNTNIQHKRQDITSLELKPFSPSETLNSDPTILCLGGNDPQIRQQLRFFCDFKHLVELRQYYSYTESLPPYTSTSYMASTVSKPHPLGDSKHGGALFTLPREIRDEIYRHLVKESYVILFPSGFIHESAFKLVDKPDLGIFLISQAISLEAQEVFYSESVFHCSMDFKSHDSLAVSTQMVKRIKNLKIEIQGINYSYHDDYYTSEADMMATWKTFIGDLRGTETLRNTIHIRFCSSTPAMIEPLSNCFLPPMRAFTGFRTVVVEISPLRSYQIQMKHERSESAHTDRTFTAVYQRMIHVVKEAMEPSLGRATISNKGFGNLVEFHPREHVSAILKARAKKLLLDAEKIGAGRLSERAQAVHGWEEGWSDEGRTQVVHICESEAVVLGIYPPK